MYKHASISDLLGKTIKQITGLEAGSDSVDFECEDGSLFRMYHQQDCCESVSIDDIEGDASDLVGQPLVVAEDVSSEDFQAPPGDYVESYTWTFYRLATAKGFVVIRWLGESNGYYSESVD
ncbi:TPA: hypothetical protein NIE44_006350, partial [Pseudomonas aeruginosa]|nr:hypothetical protein [Pseudomonas aeruginosa]